MSTFQKWTDDISVAWSPGIFIAQFVGFVIIVLVLRKYAVPPVKKLMKERQEAIRQQLVDSADAATKLESAKTAHDQAITRANDEAAGLQTQAVADAAAIEADLAAEADREVTRIGAGSATQLDLHRAGLLRKLRGELGASAVDSASALVRAHLADADAQSASIDRAIADLESMAGSTGVASVPPTVDLAGVHSLRAGSREAARTINARFEELAPGLDTAQLISAADDLVNVLTFLHANPVLRKRVADPVENAAGKEQFIRGLFGGRISDPALEMLVVAGAGHWSSTADFVTGVRRQAALAVLEAADRDGSNDQVEDDLFRTGRVLEGYPQLTVLLDDTARPAAERVGLLRSVLGDKVSTNTWYLLSHALLAMRGHSVEVVVDQLAVLAAARKGQTVAHVQSATEPTDAQRDRLAAVLGSIYGRAITVQSEVVPELLGGLRVTVGDEVIDADVASRLEKAALTLPN